MEILKCSTELECKSAAQEELGKWFKRYTELPICFLSSGGSALELLDLPAELGNYSNLTLSVLDERFSRSQEENNFMKLSATRFFKETVERGAKFWSTLPLEGENMKTLALRITEYLTAWILEHPKGKIISTMGMGTDGHTAGILPMPEDPTLFNVLFNDPAFWIQAYDAGQKSHLAKRVTVTNVFLKNKIDIALSYVVGENKKDAFREFKSSTSNLEQIPVRVWHYMKQVKVFTTL